MDWEVHHNRRRPEPPAWSQWSPMYPVTYLCQWALYCFVIPFILGMVMTPLGILFITVVIDYFQYIKAIRLEEY